MSRAACPTGQTGRRSWRDARRASMARRWIDAAAAGATMRRRTPWTTRVRSITAPTLVLLGADQDSPTSAGLRTLADELPDGELDHVPGRHLAMIQAPEAFAATLERFLGRQP